MRMTERVLAQLIARTGGRCDRTIHIHRHITHPLGLSEREVAASVVMLREGGVIEADPMFPSLIRLTAHASATRGCPSDVCEPGAAPVVQTRMAALAR